MAELLDGVGMTSLYTGANAEWRGSYLGFTYNGHHSSELGIVRVSDSGRYNDPLLPNSQDKTSQVTGRDGVYYFGSNYTQRQLTINFAFDALSDAQLRTLRQVFGDKRVHELIFDEMPYKVYHAKITSNSIVKHICFDAMEIVNGSEVNRRIFKGEGSIQATCYYPFATSRYKYLSSYTKENIPEWVTDDDINLSEWQIGSGIINQGTYDIYSNGGFSTYNPGDLETDWTLKISRTSALQGGKIKLNGTSKGIELASLSASDLPVGGYIIVNSKTHLIEGYDNYNQRSNYFNNKIVAGDFFKIPLGINKLNIEGFGATTSIWDGVLEYNYIYF